MAADEDDQNVWGYTPNRAVPVVFAVLFTASGCWHVWQAQHYKSWKMTLLLPVGSLFYVAGLVTREAGAFFPSNDGLFIASRVLTLDATAVAAAANYFTLGRTLYYIPYASPVDPRRATQIFIFLDWLIGIFVVVGLSHVYKDGAYNVRIGGAFVRASLVLQIMLYALYLGVLGIWYRRVLRMKVQRPLAKSYIRALYVCGFLVLVRCVYRTIEYFQGSRDTVGYLEVHEAYYYVFDALPILSMLVLLNVFHPGEYFPEDSSVYLATDGVTQVRGPGWSDERRWYWTVVDPLGVADCMRIDKSKPKFWEVDGVQGNAEVSQSRSGTAA